MTLFNPEPIAKLICATWRENSLLRHYPTPNTEKLAQLFEIVFLASMEAEEGRPLRFGVMLIESFDADEKNFGVARLKNPRSLSVPEIQRLAPATTLSSNFIAVEQLTDELRIWGTVDVGSDWTIFNRAESSSGVMLPMNLTITVSAPGTISIRFSELLLIAAERGRIVGSGSNVLKFGPINDFFQQALRQLLSEAFPDRQDLFADDHFIISYGGEYIRFLVRMLQYAEELRHGGTVIFLREEDTSQIADHVEIKYEIANLAMWEQLVEGLRLIFAETEATRELDAALIDHTAFEAWNAIKQALAGIERKLVDLSRLISRLTQVDGALVITDHFRVLGFGAVIKDLTKAPYTVKICHDERGKLSAEKRSEAYGTRHRSAMALCRKIDCVIFVLSQDGGVKALTSADDAVWIWPSILLGPTSWFLTAQDLIPEIREEYLNRRPWEQ